MTEAEIQELISLLKGETVSTIQEKCQRANTIEQIVQDQYADEDTDAADLALDEILTNENRTDKEIAAAVAMRITYP